MDGKKIIKTESTVRIDLQLEDVDCLPNATIFEQLALIGEAKEKEDTQIPPVKLVRTEHDSRCGASLSNKVVGETVCVGGGPRRQETMGNTTARTRCRSWTKGTDKKWRSKSMHRLSKDECTFSHEKGNWKRDYPKLKTKDNYYKGKGVAEENVTKCDDEELDLSLATSSMRNAFDIWLLDIACSHHITPHRE
ncbi:hypothetical protein Tco_0790282 [Tanacetum coccineum]